MNAKPKPKAEPEAKKRGIAKRPSLAQAIVAPKSEEVETPDFDKLTDTEEKYLISKGKLDYGPFSLAAIVEDIRSNQVLPGHIIIDKDTGERVNVEDHPLLAQLVDEAKQRRDDARRARPKSNTRSRRRAAASRSTPSLYRRSSSSQRARSTGRWRGSTLSFF